MPAGVVFAVALLALAAGAGWRAGRPSVAAVGSALRGGVVLVAAWLTSRTGVAVDLAPVNAAIARVDSGRRAHRHRGGGRASRRPVQRGARLGRRRMGAGADDDPLRARCIFPLYGVGALPLDLAVGLLLGGLRIVSGGVLAPAIAHVIADLAGGWLL